jgi:hypothetical protein
MGNNRKQFLFLAVSSIDPDTDADSDPENMGSFVADHFCINGSPERPSLLGSNGQGLWI